MPEYYAHSLPGRPQEEWQRLEDHLRNVAEMVRGFADDFGAGEWAYLDCLPTSLCVATIVTVDCKELKWVTSLIR